jgi:hypothetical protein
LELLNGQSNHSTYFKKHIRTYNAAFALASLGVKIDNTVLDGRPCVQDSGVTISHVGALKPEVGKQPVYAQLYFYSSEEANEARLHRNRVGHQNMASLRSADSVIAEQGVDSNLDIPLNISTLSMPLDYLLPSWH